MPTGKSAGGSGLYQRHAEVEPHYSFSVLKEVLRNQKENWGNTRLGEDVSSQRSASFWIMRFLT